MVLTVGLTAFNFVLNFFKLKLSASTAKVKVSLHKLIFTQWFLSNSLNAQTPNEGEFVGVGTNAPT